jgi:hypothetical protein
VRSQQQSIALVTLWASWTALALALPACGTDTDIAARVEASSCGGLTSRACAGGVAPAPDGDAPDRYDGVTGGSPPVATLDASVVDARIEDAQTHDHDHVEVDAGSGVCPATPPAGECPDREGAMCRYGDTLCACFSALWWCAREVRYPGGPFPGPVPSTDAGLEPVQSACPPFPPSEGGPCFAPMLQCSWGNVSCVCDLGAWRC